VAPRSARAAAEIVGVAEPRDGTGPESVPACAWPISPSRARRPMTCRCYFTGVRLWDLKPTWIVATWLT
jgi:hypothetical protein